MESFSPVQASTGTLDHERSSITQGLPSELGSDPSLLSQATIMMVDDEVTTMEVMQTFLEDAGYQRFVLIEHSSQAISEIETCRPDILLLDLVMPEVSGFEILHQIRSHSLFKHLPVIMLTSSSDAETKLEALDRGATDFLAKPVDPSELVLRVRNTLAAKAYQNQLAYYDALTHLPNRSLFLDRLTWFLQQAESRNDHLVMLHISLPQFKRIYNTFGPQVGDKVIKQIANRIQACVRGTDLLGKGIQEEQQLTCLFHVSGDEFSVVCPHMAHPEHAMKIASRIIEAMSIPFDADGTEVSILPSIGMASFPGDARDVVTLVQCAIGASAQVSSQDQGSYQFYSREMNAKSHQHLKREAALRHAIEDKQLIMHYQPQISVATGEILGTEALARWQQPDGTLVSPNDFIPLAEETGIVVPLGEWALREVCNQLSSWQAQGIWIRVSVNLSAKQFHGGSIVQSVRDALLSHHVDQQYLTLELTESLIMENVEQTTETLNQLIALGIKVSMDDFGTGYSSLSYLKSLPLHELKIDRSFMMDITDNPEDKALVSAIIYLAHEFHLNVVAEGVEKQEQRDILATLKCDQYQGHFFSPPVSATDLTAIFVRSSVSQKT